ncbi:QacE family quaternary ammonium compound efflux SMR transporter [Cryobacterium sinapicolor]|uniref:QacE family quaternary ammonium compound efflux SMR transporter n=1 Tax=Cryobacterium sinapicolor TaxID=1259236 RepID=A0ABY2JLM2_9MICO|nr:MULTISPECIES: SMR family transporter [Cryobacterium]TFC86815.1 QacE family quaternary ammonium compound efflux SMR transporter [Cryobacterium sp. TMT3-29-2]TFD06218.1 QacE family quaternary ammonium compound efflux SMR transporter [Cryobacterium sinapicolor]
MAYLLLVGAILFEVSGTISLRLAIDNRRWYTAVAIGYLVSFSMLGLALAQGMPVGIAYGIWAAAGVALTAILSRFLFKDPLTRLMSLGIIFIIGGVLLIELGAPH